MERDPISFAATGIDYAHREIHGGSHYFCTYWEIVGDGGDAELRITTPNRTDALRAHLLFGVQSTLETRLQIYEDSGASSGTVITPRNNYRDLDASKPATLVVAHTPTAGAIGSLIWEERWGSDTLPGNRPGAGGFSRGDSEWILKNNTTYLLRVISGTAANMISIVLEWYEHTNK